MARVTTNAHNQMLKKLCGRQQACTTAPRPTAERKIFWSFVFAAGYRRAVWLPLVWSSLIIMLQPRSRAQCSRAGLVLSLIALCFARVHSAAARAAFVQRGVEEADAPLLHTQGSSSRISSNQLSSAISRALSLDARAEVGVTLPTGNLFNRPDVNLIVLVEGLRTRGKPVIGT
jgi:hypothetical protein